MNMHSAGILDVSFLKSSLSDEARNALRRQPVYVIQDFYAEAEALISLLDQDRRMKAEEDFRFICEVVIPQCIPDYTDAWELVRDEAGRHGKVSVFTADRFLIDRMRAFRIPFELFDLDPESAKAEPEDSDQESYSWGIWDQEKAEERPLGDVHFFPRKNDCYYLSSYQQVILSDSIFQADNDSILFRVENRPDFWAKVYIGDRLTPDLLKKIRYLMRLSQTMSVDWMEMPAVLLYSDNTCRHPVGYLERSVTVPAAGARAMRPEENGLDPAYAGLLNTYRNCVGLTKQLYYMSMFGLYAAPAVNPGRLIPFQYNAEENLFMWRDPEKIYGLNTGFAPRGASGDAYIDMNRKLYACIFYMISGDYPLDSTGRFRYWGYGSRYEKKNLFGDALWQMFENAFSGRSDFSMGRILLGLLDAYRILQGSLRQEEWRNEPPAPEGNNEWRGKNSYPDQRNLAGPRPEKKPVSPKKIGILVGIVLLAIGLIVGVTLYVRSKLGVNTFPNCVGMNQDDTAFQDVQVRLSDEGIACLSNEVYTDTMNIGEIVSQTPESMDYDDIKEWVVFDVSKGIDFRGWKEEEAREKLDKEGWKAEVEHGSSNLYPTGTVYEVTYPDVDGKRILLKINDGPFADEAITDRGISASVSAPAQTVKEHGNTTITVSFYGSIPSGCSVHGRSFDKNVVQIVSCDKQSQDEGSLVLNCTILGNGKGAGYVRFYLKDSNQNIAYVDSYITVD